MIKEPKPEEQETAINLESAKTVGKNILPYIVGVIALIFVYYLLSGVIGPNQIIDQLSDVSVARGLITFILAIGTIALAIILTLAVLLSQNPEIEKRFTQGKEVLTILIGVLGTIVGFYFGTPSTPTDIQEPLAVAQFEISKGKPGSEVTLTSLVTGGTKPYRFTLIFNTPLIKTIKNKKSANGLILEKVTIPAQADKNIGFTILIQDEADKTIVHEQKDDQGILVKPVGQQPKDAAGG